MHVFSTVLFVNGNPVGYKVFREQGSFLLNPAENPNRLIEPPALRAQHQQDGWLIEGTSDRDLIDQVIEDVTNNEAAFPQNELSAAP